MLLFNIQKLLVLKTEESNEFYMKKIREPFLLSREVKTQIQKMQHFFGVSLKEK